MKNITVAISDAQYRAARAWAAQRDTSLSAMVDHLFQNLPTVARAVRAVIAHELQARSFTPSKESQALIDIIHPPSQTENRTHAFRGVKKCDPPQPPQSQELNKAVASSHRITANV